MNMACWDKQYQHQLFYQDSEILCERITKSAKRDVILMIKEIHLFSV